MLKIAVSGAGAIAERAHLPALKAVPGVRVTAIQSRTHEKAERVAHALWPDATGRPRAYADFGAMLERERPDAVVVLTPNRLHCEYTLRAIAAGAHVLVEKPMAPSATEARRMVDAAAEARRVLMVAMQRRYGALERIAKEAIDGGAIGAPHFIRARLSHGGPQNWAPGQTWFTTAAEAGGGAMLDLGVHVADLAIWFLGEVESVTGAVATLGKQIDVEDTGAMVMRFKSGALGVIEASWSSTPGLAAIEIYGSAGRIMMGYPRLDIAIQRADGNPAPGYSRDEIMQRADLRDLLAPFRELAANFVAAIRGEARPSPDGADGLRAVETVEACYRSSRDGVRIDLPLK